MPVFADLILSSEASLKEHLREIFLDISTSLCSGKDGGQGSALGDSSGGEF